MAKIVLKRRKNYGSRGNGGSTKRLFLKAS